LKSNPILKVLSSIRANRVRALLMGGQACVFYGAAEFSRDTDLAILASSENLAKLNKALTDLDAQVIAVPPFEARYLRKGHAVHFRCGHVEAVGMRVDVMTKMRGVDSFPKLWGRRTTISVNDSTIELMSLPDLVQATLIICWFGVRIPAGAPVNSNNCWQRSEVSQQGRTQNLDLAVAQVYGARRLF
jgi:hypothetical protein